MTKVKICGLTNLDDAITAVEAGADYLGFILYAKSKRGVTDKEVQCIVSHLRSLDHCPTLVGVFVNESAEFVQQTLNFCDLDLAQLHGDESAETLQALQPNAYKAIRPQTLTEAQSALNTFCRPYQSIDHRPKILIDAYHPNLYGGTGDVGDWEIARQVNDGINLMLAGGLTPDNVADAIAEVQPYCVDVASGVEASAGKKDAAKVRAFVANAKKNSEFVDC